MFGKEKSATQKLLDLRDISPSIRESLVGRTLSLDSVFLFADDTNLVDHSTQYALGISYVPVEEFIEYRRPNGTLRANLRPIQIDRKSQMSQILVDEIGRLYHSLSEDVGGIFLCKCFYIGNIERLMNYRGIRKSEEIISKMYITEKHRGCRFHKYKQEAGDLAREHFLGL